MQALLKRKVITIGNKYLFFLNSKIHQNLISMNSDIQDKYQIKRKKIILKKSTNQAVVHSLPIPNYIFFPENRVHLLSQLRNKLKMLYINVLCRGYHIIKGLEQKNKYIFTEGMRKIQSNFPQQQWVVSNVEAVPTIWKSLAREVGRPTKSCNIFEASKQIQRAISSEPILNEEKTPETTTIAKYRLTCNQIKETRIKIFQQLGKIKNRFDLEFARQKKQRQVIAKVMRQQILFKEKSVFINSIISIKKAEESKVEIFLEQSYPRVVIPQKRASFLLGQSILSQKLAQYNRHLSRYPIIHNLFAPISACHRCMRTLNQYSSIGVCDNKNATLQVNSQILADPYTFCRIIINENYQDEGLDLDKKYIHPYLKYYSVSDNDRKPVCNRYFCNKCQRMQISLHQKGNCNYCAGVCDCKRCKQMDELIMMMAIYIDNGGDFQQLRKQFLFSFNEQSIETRSQEIKFLGYENKLSIRQVVTFLKDRKILQKKRDLPSQYQEEQFLSNKIEQQYLSMKAYKKYRMKVVGIGESELDKKVRRQKQQREKKKLQNLDKIMNGGKSLRRKDETGFSVAGGSKNDKSLEKKINQQLLGQDAQKDGIEIFFDE